MTKPKNAHTRKLDESNGSTFAARFRDEDWQRLHELQAALTTPVAVPTEADIVRWALKEAHAARVQKDSKP